MNPAPEMDASPDHPAVHSRQTAMLGNVAAEPGGTVRSPGRRRMRLPETSVSLLDITLSDERGQGDARGPADLLPDVLDVDQGRDGADLGVLRAL